VKAHSLAGHTSTHAEDIVPLSRRGGVAAAFSTVLRRLGYGCDHKALQCPEPPESLGWSPYLALGSAGAFVATAAATGMSLNGYDGSTQLFWASFAVIVVPSAIRLTWPGASRLERIWLLNMLGAGLFMTRILAHPTGFYGHDEFLHWSTTIDILERHHLFTVNSLLPVSPSYPGLEIVETYLIQMTGISAYFCSILLVFLLRFLLTSAIFIIFEKVSGSAWLGGLATLVYMVNSNYYTFLSAFSYETIAVDFLFVGFLLAVLVGRKLPFGRWRIVCLSVPIFVALAVSHHLTAWVGVIILGGVTITTFARGGRETGLATAQMFLAALLIIGFWKSVSDQVVDTYVGGIFGRSLAGFYRILEGATDGHALFVSADGQGQPIGYRIIAISSVVMISAGLVIGFFRSLGLPAAKASPAGQSPTPPRTAVFLGMRDNSWAIALTISSFAFPPSVILRLTGGGWEIGNRMAAFVYLGVGLVVAVGAALVLLGPRPSRARAMVVGLCVSVMLAGGALAELPPDLVAQKYRPAADGNSVETMGISTAEWTRQWLGEGWRFVSDRTNRLFLATYGVQRIVTQEQDGVEVGQLIIDAARIETSKIDQALVDANKKSVRLVDDDNNRLRLGTPDYFLVDLRLQLAKPLWGYYFDAGEDGDLHKSLPLAADMQKFDRFARVGRVYDNGYEVIYDVRKLLEREQLNVLPVQDASGRVDGAARLGRTLIGAEPVQSDAGAARATRSARAGRAEDGQNLPARAIVNYDAGVTRYVTK
jgi:hypothetical protein